MATDYDAPRQTEEGVATESIEDFKAHRSSTSTATIDADETEDSEEFELPGADLSGEELLITVVPQQKDEFTCMSCFLVRHRSQIARERDGLSYCRDCEG